MYERTGISPSCSRRSGIECLVETGSRHTTARRNLRYPAASPPAASPPPLGRDPGLSDHVMTWVRL